MRYRVFRVDVSEVFVEADSPEEAVVIANNNPYRWWADIGETEVEKDERFGPE
jgi:hypothetical protein